jgi:zinc D-Ala-D-Ala carboxypeptidase
MQYVSKYVDYATVIRSDAAKRAGLINYFNKDQLKNIERVAKKVYDPLVDHFREPIYISSFFRSKEVNTLIGGSLDSHHMANGNAAAIDLDADNNFGISNKDIFDYIKDNLDFDQLILEDIKDDGSIGWVHVSYKEKGNRKQVLTMVKVNGKTTYQNYG